MKRLVTYIAAALVVLILLLLVGTMVMSLRVNSQFAARRTAMRAAGLPASIADLAPPSIPDSRNAAAQINTLRPQLGAFASDHGGFFNTPLGKAYDEAHDRGEPLTEEQAAAIKSILDKHSQLQSGLSQAAACDAYASQLDFSQPHDLFLKELLKDVQHFRTLSRYAFWRMDILVYQRKLDEAVAQGVEVLRLSRLRQAEPTLVNQLVTIAVRDAAAQQLYAALAAGSVSAETRSALDSELSQLDDPKWMKQVIETERAMGLDMLGSTAGPGLHLAERMFGWSVKQHYLGVLDFYDKLLAALDNPPQVARKQVVTALKSPTGLGAMADLLAPGVEASLDAHLRTVAIVRSLRVFNALQQYAEAHGREAAGLDDLNLPPAATTDPFTGQSLKLKRTADGWKVYSVMKNEVDDGGDFEGMKDYGVAPPVPAKRQSDD